MKAPTSNQLKALTLSSSLLSKKLFAGNFLSIFARNGIDFKELREYTNNDDFRNIDWRTTAKLDKPYIKVNEEKRQHHIVFLIDVSKSIEFGNNDKDNGAVDKDKKDIIAELCFLLSYSSNVNNDKIGAVFFSDIIEKTIPLSNSKSTLYQFTNMLYNFHPTNSSTNIAKGLHYLNNYFGKDTIVFMFSDFLDNLNFCNELSIAAKKFKILAFQITDKQETTFRYSGIFPILNPETGKIALTKISKQTFEDAKVHQNNLENLMREAGANFIKIDIRDNYLSTVKSFFDRIANFNR